MKIRYSMEDGELKVVDVERRRKVIIHHSYYDSGKANKEEISQGHYLVIPDNLFNEVDRAIRSYNRKLGQNKNYLFPRQIQHVDILKEELVNMISIVMKENLWTRINEVPVSSERKQRILDRGLTF